MTHNEHVKKALEEAIPFVDSRGYGGVAHIMYDALELLKEQEAKTGHWVEQQINSYTRSTTCSVCGESAPFVFVSDDRYGRNGYGKDELTKYCPNCGAKMEGPTRT